MSTININDRNICLKVSLSLPPFLQFSDMRSQLLLQCHACLPAARLPAIIGMASTDLKGKVPNGLFSISCFGHRIEK